MLPAPNLDDRRFQDLVDDAKRLVQQRCPEWTDHNVHDPGVTLIETFAWMTDQLLYRLNRVPDRAYVKFLDLIGVQLFPPTAARAEQTFWLSAPVRRKVVVPAQTEVSTQRLVGEDPVVFATEQSLDIVPCRVAHMRSALADGTMHEHDTARAVSQPFACFSPTPAVDDAVLFGLSDAVPANIVSLRLDCSVDGIGVDPDFPPLVWEAWTGEGWQECELERDTTGGINKAGEVVLYVPSAHATSIIGGQRAGWLRARVVEPVEGVPRYSASPTIRKAESATVGGVVSAMHATRVHRELLGISEGVPGQTFLAARPPLLPGDPQTVVEVSEDGSSDEGWVAWTLVDDFAHSSPADLHCQIDHAHGEVRFGPAVREADGALRQYGAVPPKGAAVRLRSYVTGGGQRGNVAPRTLIRLVSTLPFVSRVENRRSARGGSDAESVENAKARGPMLLRTRGRAVTADDYELIAQEAAHEAARVRAISADADSPGSVRVLVVPSVNDDRGRLEFGQLVPEEATLQRIATALDSRRVLGVRVSVEPARYQGVTAVARCRGRDGYLASNVEESAREALFRYFHPLTGGPDGAGWPFGRTVHVGEVYSVLQQVHGIDIVEDARLFPADPVTGQRSGAQQQIELDAGALVFSFDHQVRVTI